MKKTDFTYQLPEELIAQQPVSPRDAARLMVLERGSKAMQHHHFYDLPTLLRPGDVLVINNSKVLPARLYGTKEGEERRFELLLLREDDRDIWECLAKPGKKLKRGERLVFGDGSLQAEILATLDNGGKRVRFTYNTASLQEKLDAFGSMPLPPYIISRKSSPEDYQTVYASADGSAAAPTAGLHFTCELMQTLSAKGIEFAEVTLHVGLGTFRPVKADNIEDHQMHSEWYTLDSKAVETVARAKREGRRVIAVGTTSCRTLEGAVAEHGELTPCSGETQIFLYPGAEFHVIDGLITNFHLPESTLLMLVSAFYGREATLAAYEEAIRLGYRFFSFGDAMMIV